MFHFFQQHGCHHQPHSRFSTFHRLWHAAGHSHGRGPFSQGKDGHGFAGGFGGGDDFRRGRKFSSEDLQLLLLALLENQPSHGYELIKALASRSNGFYSPSPGMVYPALTYLEELDYVSVEQEGSRKCYALTETGLNYLESHREHVNMMWAKLNHIAHRMDSVRRAFSGEENTESNDSGWIDELEQARHAIKMALFRRAQLPVDEQKRIAAILQQAVQQIENPQAQASSDKAI